MGLEFTRRTFLKGVLSLAFSAAIPVGLIEKATELIETIPDKKSKVAGYFKINGFLVPVNQFEISRPMGDVIIKGDYFFRSIPELPTMTFSTTMELPKHWIGLEAFFSIADEYLPFELTGKGWFHETENIIALHDEPINHIYSLMCEIDQYKSEENYCV